MKIFIGVILYLICFDLFASQSKLIFRGTSKDGQFYTDPCVEGVVYRTLADANSKFDSLFSVNRETIYSSINATGNVRVKLPLVKGDFSATLETFVGKTNENSSYYLMFSALRYSDIQNTIRLSSRGKEITDRTDDKGFIESKCGVGFVNRVDYGGELFLKLNVQIYQKNTTLKFNQNFNVYIKIFKKKIKISVRIKKETGKHDLNVKVGFEGLQLGGIPAKLQEKINEMNSKNFSCQISSTTDACSVELDGENGALTSFFNYLSDFQKQIVEEDSIYKIYTRTYKDAKIKELASVDLSSLTKEQQEARRTIYFLRADYRALLNLYSENLKGHLYSRVQRSLLSNNLASINEIYIDLASMLEKCDSESKDECVLDNVKNSNYKRKYKKYSLDIVPDKNLYFYCASRLVNNNSETSSEMKKLDVDKILDRYLKQFDGESDFERCQKVEDYFQSPQSNEIDLSNLGMKTIEILYNYPKITNLNLSLNEDICNEENLSVLRSFKNLKVLDLSKTGLDDRCVSSFVDVFKKITNLNLEFNKIFGNEIIYNIVREKKAFLDLRLAGNFLDLNHEIVNELFNLFDLRKNASEVIYGMRNLTMFGNFFTEISEEQVRESFLNLESVRDLSNVDFKLDEEKYFCSSLKKYYKEYFSTKENHGKDLENPNYIELYEFWTGFTMDPEEDISLNNCTDLIKYKNKSQE